MGWRAAETGLQRITRMFVPALAAAVFSAAGAAVSRADSRIPNIPLMYTTTYSRAERAPMSHSAPKEISSSMDNSVTFGSALPGVGSLSESVNMNFMQAQRRSPGSKTTTTNLGYILNMKGRNMQYSSGYTLVEGETSSQGKIEGTKNENTFMGVNVSWPRMPFFGIMFSNYNAGKQSSESGLLNMSYRVGGTSVSFNQVHSLSASQASPASESESSSLAVSRQQLNSRKLSVMTNMSMARQRSLWGGTPNNKSTSGSFSVNIDDSHIRMMPIGINYTSSRSRQKTMQGVVENEQSNSGSNFNIFSNIIMPGGVRTAVSYNIGTGKSSTAAGTNKTRILSINSAKKINGNTSVNYNFSAQYGGSSSKNSGVSMTTYVYKNTAVAMQWTQTGQAGTKSGGLSLNVTTRLPGGILATQQYMTSRGGSSARTKSENTTMSVPLGRGASFSFSSSARRLGPKKDSYIGFTHSMPLNRTSSFSTTYNKQKAAGETQSRMWNVNYSAMLPMHTTLNMGLSVQRDKDNKNISSTVAITGAL